MLHFVGVAAEGWATECGSRWGRQQVWLQLGLHCSGCGCSWGCIATEAVAALHHNGVAVGGCAAVVAATGAALQLWQLIGCAAAGVAADGLCCNILQQRQPQSCAAGVAADGLRCDRASHKWLDCSVSSQGLRCSGGSQALCCRLGQPCANGAALRVWEKMAALQHWQPQCCTVRGLAAEGWAADWGSRWGCMVGVAAYGLHCSRCSSRWAALQQLRCCTAKCWQPGAALRGGGSQGLRCRRGSRWRCTAGVAVGGLQCSSQQVW